MAVRWNCLVPSLNSSHELQKHYVIIDGLSGCEHGDQLLLEHNHLLHIDTELDFDDDIVHNMCHADSLMGITKILAGHDHIMMKHFYS